MALKDSPSAPVVRPPANDAVILKRLLWMLDSTTS